MHQEEEKMMHLSTKGKKKNILNLNRVDKMLRARGFGTSREKWVLHGVERVAASVGVHRAKELFQLIGKVGTREKTTTTNNKLVINKLIF